MMSEPASRPPRPASRPAATAEEDDLVITAGDAFEDEDGRCVFCGCYKYGPSAPTAGATSSTTWLSCGGPAATWCRWRCNA